MTEEEKGRWFLLGKKTGREEAQREMRMALGLLDAEGRDRCLHCEHREQEHD